MEDTHVGTTQGSAQSLFGARMAAPCARELVLRPAGGGVRRACSAMKTWQGMYSPDTGRPELATLADEWDPVAAIL